jgi:hypothetical protein
MTSEVAAAGPRGPPLVSHVEQFGAVPAEAGGQFLSAGRADGAGEHNDGALPQARGGTVRAEQRVARLEPACGPRSAPRRSKRRQPAAVAATRAPAGPPRTNG